MTTDVTRRSYASDAAQDDHAETASRWKSRPIAAALCRLAIALAPVLVASALTVSVQVFVLSRVLAGRGLLPHVLAYLGLAAVTLTVTVLVERVARRALPLVALLRLTMLFTDQAPSRFQMARTAGNPAALARLADRSDEQGAAAAQVLALLARLTEHERRTRGHSERVRVYADVIAEQLGLSEDDRMRLRLAAVVHDIGKLTVPADVLLKPGRPSPEEWVTLKGHPEAGIGLAGAVIDWLGPWTGAINEHHERYDGQGYPRGLAGKQISLAGRIVAVADAFETMTSSRSYKKPMTVTAARRELSDCAGAHFDPDVVRAFTEISLPRLCRRTLGAGILVNLPLLGSLQVGAASLAGSAGPVGTTLVTGLAGGVPAGAAAMTVLASSVAIGVVPASAAVGPPARPAPVSAVQHPAAPPADGRTVVAAHPPAALGFVVSTHALAPTVATTLPASSTAKSGPTKAVPTKATPPKPAPPPAKPPKPVKAAPRPPKPAPITAVAQPPQQHPLPPPHPVHPAGHGDDS
ncbi:MAG TPA: HD-GYP domain-containing protein [Mycobacteriales bacterium]